VKAVQELSVENTLLKAEIASMKLENEVLMLRMEKLEAYIDAPR
jgi:hypothetical protein